MRPEDEADLRERRGCAFVARAARHDQPDPDRPMARRRNSSIEVLAGRVVAVRDAWVERDEPALRTELRALASEASLLAAVHPLLPADPLRQRQRIYAEAQLPGFG